MFSGPAKPGKHTKNASDLRKLERDYPIRQCMSVL